MGTAKLYREHDYLACPKCDGDQFRVALGFDVSILGFECTGCGGRIPIAVLIPERLGKIIEDEDNQQEG